MRWSIYLLLTSEILVYKLGSNSHLHQKTVYTVQSKMKLSLLFVAILGVATVSAVPTGKALPRSTRSLSDDWADFFALIPTDRVVEICIQYLAEDAEVQNAVAYVLSDDFKTLVQAVEAIPEYIAFLNYLHNGGLNVYHYVNMLHEFLGISQLSVPATVSVSRLASARITGGIAGLYADLKAVLPLAELRALYDEKLQTSSDFADLVSLLSSDEARHIYSELKANEEYQHIRATLVAYGLDIDHFFDMLRAFIGFA